jgi:two-component system KDP operon response regulator KdpE
MSGARILVVDDEPGIRRTLRAYLSEHGYKATAVASGEEAVEAVGTQRPDVVLLDLAMPGIGGLEACRQIRARWSTPIVVLSVKNQEREKVEALDAGADDYVTKPFGPEELLARIRVALRHRAGVASGEEPVYRSGDLVVDVGRRLVTLHGEPIHLTPTEYDLLCCLAAHADRVVTHALALRTIWGIEHSGETQLLRFAILQLRKKLQDDPLHPRYIFTEPGVGYRFRTVPVEE